MFRNRNSVKLLIYFSLSNMNMSSSFSSKSPALTMLKDSLIRNKTSPISYTAKIIFVVTVAMSIIGLFLTGGMVLSSGSIVAIAILSIGLVMMGVVLITVFLLIRKQPIKQLEQYVEEWCLKTREEDVANARIDPMFSDDFVIASDSTNILYQTTLDHCKSNTLRSIYRSNEGILKCLFAVSELDFERRHFRKIMGYYCILKKASDRSSELFWEYRNSLPDSYAPLFATTSERDFRTRCLINSSPRDGYLTPFKAGPRYIWHNYLSLRRREDPKLFYDPNHPYYAARLVFNDTIDEMKQIFDLKKIKQYLLAIEKKNLDQEPSEHPEAQNLRIILDICSMKDKKGSKFLEKCKTYVFPTNHRDAFHSFSIGETIAISNFD